MELKFTKEQMEKIIKAYYKIYEEKGVEVNIVVSRGCEGQYETPCVNVKVVVISEVSLLGVQAKEEKTLSKSEVTDVFKKVLNEEGYKVSNIYYDAGLTTTEYLTRSYPSTYFSGANVEVEKTVGQKVKTI